ncbi:hypothetical protein Q1695_011682 [Nippostrongylus brasiliensis]|nr:hypothetical protein Q1695_011682 [Nippostrongylus brasiliensis]
MPINSPGKKQRVRRCLFGKPDPVEVDKWLSENTDRQLKSSQEKWSFDFENDTPVKGDVEYEVIPVDKVPSLYKPYAPAKKRIRKAAEFDPSVPSASSGEPEIESGSSVHRPVTRSCVKRGSGSPRGLKQAMLTNYLKVRKRRSAEQGNSKHAAESLKGTKPAPSSPFRFVSEEQSSAVTEGESSRSSSRSPPKSPRKRPAQRVTSVSSHSRPKLRSHSVANH